MLHLTCFSLFSSLFQRKSDNDSKYFTIINFPLTMRYLRLNTFGCFLILEQLESYLGTLYGHSRKLIDRMKIEMLLL